MPLEVRTAPQSAPNSTEGFEVDLSFTPEPSTKQQTNNAGAVVVETPLKEYEVVSPEIDIPDDSPREYEGPEGVAECRMQELYDRQDAAETQLAVHRADLDAIYAQVGTADEEAEGEIRMARDRLNELEFQQAAQRELLGRIEAGLEGKSEDTECIIELKKNWDAVARGHLTEIARLRAELGATAEDHLLIIRQKHQDLLSQHHTRVELAANAMAVELADAVKIAKVECRNAAKAALGKQLTDLKREKAQLVLLQAKAAKKPLRASLATTTPLPTAPSTQSPSTKRARKNLLAKAAKNQAVLRDIAAERSAGLKSMEDLTAAQNKEKGASNREFAKKSGKVMELAVRDQEQAKILVKEVERLDRRSTGQSAKFQAKCAKQKRKLLLKAQKLDLHAQGYLDQVAKMQGKQDRVIMDMEIAHERAREPLRRQEGKRAAKEIKYMRKVADIHLRVEVLDKRSARS